MPRRAAPPPPTPTPSSSYKEWLESAEHCQWCGSDDWQPGPPSKRTLIYCTSCAVACTHIECSEQYDVYAMTVEKAASGEEDWFCSEECEQVYHKLCALQNKRTPLPSDPGYTFELLKHDPNHRSNVATVQQATRILHDAFGAIHMDDGADQLRCICTAATSPDDDEEHDGYDYSGFRLAVLRQGASIVAVATVRVFGTHFAEMPYVSTQQGVRRAGHFRRLMQTLESTLHTIGVQHILVPSVPQTLVLWQRRCGYTRMSASEVQCLDSHIVLPDLASVVLLKKTLGAVQGGGVQAAQRPTRSRRRTLRLPAPPASSSDEKQGDHIDVQEMEVRSGEVQHQQQQVGYGEYMPTIEEEEGANDDGEEEGEEDDKENLATTAITKTAATAKATTKGTAKISKNKQASKKPTQAAHDTPNTTPKPTAPGQTTTNTPLTPTNASAPPPTQTTAPAAQPAPQPEQHATQLAQPAPAPQPTAPVKRTRRRTATITSTVRRPTKYSAARIRKRRLQGQLMCRQHTHHLQELLSSPLVTHMQQLQLTCNEQSTMIQQLHAENQRLRLCVITMHVDQPSPQHVNTAHEHACQHTHDCTTSSPTHEQLDHPAPCPHHHNHQQQTSPTTATTTHDDTSTPTPHPPPPATHPTPPTTPDITTTLERALAHAHAQQITYDTITNEIQSIYEQTVNSMVNELQTLRTHVVSLTAQAEALQQRHVEVQLQLEDTLEQLAEARVAQEQQQQQQKPAPEVVALQQELACVRQVLHQARASESELLGKLARTQKHAAALTREKDDLRVALQHAQQMETPPSTQQPAVGSKRSRKSASSSPAAFGSPVDVQAAAAPPPQEERSTTVASTLEQLFGEFVQE